MTLAFGRMGSLLGAALATLVLALLFAAILDQVRSGPSRTSPTARAVVPDRRLQGERAVESAQKRLAAFPDEPVALTQLADAYLLRARETGDPSYYSRAAGLLRPALAARPDDPDAIIAAGSLALARHEFADALVLGRGAVELAPYTSAGYGVVTDALVELGRYREAITAAQQMIDRRPDLASYSRVSYLRELHGDLPGAEEMMRLAVGSGPPTGEATAWSEVQLGHLQFARGDLDGAARSYERATRRVDGYVYGVAGLARAQAARGDLAGAARLYEDATQRLPQAEFVIALGDTYARLGDGARAEQQYELVGAMQKLLAANGVRTDIDLALFNADHGRDLAGALQAARAEYEIRPSVHVADTLAWAEYETGDLASARAHSKEALRLGTRDPLMLYRAGVIAQANAETERAFELLKASSDLNPRFSILYADDLAARLRTLSEGRAPR